MGYLGYGSRPYCWHVPGSIPGLSLMNVGYFEDEDGYHYCLSYTVDLMFIAGLLDAIGVAQFRDSDGKPCWIDGDFPITGRQDVQVVRPMHKDEGTPFVVSKWLANARRYRTCTSPAGGAS